MSTVLYKKRGPVAIITLNRPEAMNAYDGGLELAQACDLRIASSTASFGCPEVRWSIIHGYGAMRLVRTVPAAVAMEMLLTGRPIDAKRAYAIGLVSRVVEPDQLLATAIKMAETIAENGPLAIKITKEPA
jgi:enoyl-CoA hydratase/carnithine racemase